MRWDLTNLVHKHNQLNAYCDRQNQTGTLHRVVCADWRMLAVQVIDHERLVLADTADISDAGAGAPHSQYAEESLEHGGPR